MAEYCREVSMSKEIGDIESIEAVLRQPIIVDSIERKAYDFVRLPNTLDDYLLTGQLHEHLKLDTAPTIGKPFSSIDSSVRAVLVGRKQDTEGAVWVFHPDAKPITIQIGPNQEGWSMIPIRAEKGESGRILEKPRLLYLYSRRDSAATDCA